MQHSEPRPAKRHHPVPASLLAATLLAALNGWTHAQTTLPANPTAQGSAPVAAPGFPAPAPAAPPAGAAPTTQSGRPGFGSAPQSSAARAPVPALSTVQSPPVTGLPPDAPKLVINGGVHSPNPARRRVIVNGQVVREGADLGAGVVLQQIRRDSVVLGFRGEQFHVTY